MSDHENWDGVERRKPQEGFAVNSWSSLVSLMSICMMAVGGISWGLKLEARIDKYTDLQTSLLARFLADLATTQSLVARGILPVTEAKLQAIEQRINGMERELKECLRKNRGSADMQNRTSPRVSTMPPAMGDTAGTISTTTWDK